MAGVAYGPQALKLSRLKSSLLSPVLSSTSAAQTFVHYFGIASPSLSGSQSLSCTLLNFTGLNISGIN